MSAQVQRSTLDKLFKITERLYRESYLLGLLHFYVYPMY